MNLEAEEAFAGVVFFVLIDKIDAFLAVEPGLDVVAFATDLDGIPFVPFEELSALLGELCTLFLVAFVWVKPAAASFVVETSGLAGALTKKLGDWAGDTALQAINSMKGRLEAMLGGNKVAAFASTALDEAKAKLEKMARAQKLEHLKDEKNKEVLVGCFISYPNPT